MHIWMFLQHGMMASQDRTGFRERLDGPLKILILGHSFVAGFKEFLQEDPTRRNFKLNLSIREFMIQFSGRRGASIYRIRSDLEIVADFQPHVCILQLFPR